MFKEIYKEMRNCEYPFYIWGNGSMAHVVYKKLQDEGISVAGYFVNVNTQWQEQHDDLMPCLTLQQLREQERSFAVVMGHGHIELMAKIQQEALVKSVYVIPNPYDYYLPDKEVISQALAGGLEEVYTYLADQESRDNLWAYFAVHSDRYQEFYQKVRKLEGMFTPYVWQLRETEVYYDVGAWNGDTVREFLAASKGNYKAIEAFEPDPDASKVLRQSVRDLKNIHCHQMGLASTAGKMQIQGSGTQSAFMESTDKGSIPVCRLDDITGELLLPTLLKIGVPRLTLDILQGAEKLIRKVKPRLIISIAWGGGNDLLDTIKLVHRTNPEYQLALRYRLLLPTQLWLYAY